MMSIRSLTVAGLLTATVSGVAMAHGSVSIGIGLGLPGVYVAPAPVYVEPQPVYVDPGPVYVEPPVVYRSYEAYRPYYYGSPVWYPRREHWKHRHHRDDDDD